MSQAEHTQQHTEAQLQDRDDAWATALRDAQAGNAAAFARFYDSSCRVALGLARRMAPQHAQDVLQEAYAQAWRELHRFDAQRGSAAAWLLTMVRSRALDLLRREKLRRTESLDTTGADEPQPQHQTPDTSAGPEALLEATQAKSALHRALADLSHDERWVLGLAYFKDMSQSEISQSTGLPLGTVKSLATRAQHKLRAALAARGLSASTVSGEFS